MLQEAVCVADNISPSLRFRMRAKGLRGSWGSISQSHERKVNVLDNRSGDNGEVLSHWWEIIINRRLVKWVFRVDILDNYVSLGVRVFTRMIKLCSSFFLCIDFSSLASHGVKLHYLTCVPLYLNIVVCAWL